MNFTNIVASCLFQPSVGLHCVEKIDSTIFILFQQSNLASPIFNFSPIELAILSVLACFFDKKILAVYSKQKPVYSKQVIPVINPHMHTLQCVLVRLVHFVKILLQLKMVLGLCMAPRCLYACLTPKVLQGIAEPLQVQSGGVRWTES